MKKRFEYILIINLLIILTGCQKAEDSTITKIIITGLKDYIVLNENVQLSAKGLSGKDTIEIEGVEWLIVNDGCYILTNNQLMPVKTGSSSIRCRYKNLETEKKFDIIESPGVINKYIFNIENLLPPSEPYYISEGNCGESILWTICQLYGMNYTQDEINKIGGDPGRGLYGGEVVKVLDSLKIQYNDIEKAATWESTVDTLKNIIIRGNPIIVGVKIYPDTHPQWYCDHFILFTGTNTMTKEFYYNSVSMCCYSITYEKLCNTKNGYSLVNKHNALYAIEIVIPR